MSKANPHTIFDLVPPHQNLQKIYQKYKNRLLKTLLWRKSQIKILLDHRSTCLNLSSPLFCFGLDKCQVPTKISLSLPLLSWTGERKYDERLVNGDKDRETSLMNYHHGHNRLNLWRREMFNLSPIKSEQDNEK